MSSDWHRNDEWRRRVRIIRGGRREGYDFHGRLIEATRYERNRKITLAIATLVVLLLTILFVSHVRAQEDAGATISGWGKLEGWTVYYAGYRVCKEVYVRDTWMECIQ